MVEGLRPSVAQGQTYTARGQRSPPTRVAELPLHLQRKLRQLQHKDQELRLSQLDPTNLRYETGPDGKRYAVDKVEEIAAKEVQKEQQTADEKSQAERKADLQREDAAAVDTGSGDQQAQASSSGTKSKTTKKLRLSADLPAEAFRPLTPAEQIRRARVEAAYAAAAATGPRVNVSA